MYFLRIRSVWNGIFANKGRKRNKDIKPYDCFYEAVKVSVIMIYMAVQVENIWESDGSPLINNCLIMKRFGCQKNVFWGCWRKIRRGWEIGAVILREEKHGRRYERNIYGEDN